MVQPQGHDPMEDAWTQDRTISPHPMRTIRTQHGLRTDLRLRGPARPSHLLKHMGQTYRQTYRLTYRQTYRKIYRLTYRQTYRHTYRQTYRHIYRLTCRQTYRLTCRQTYRQTYRLTYRQT
uniref:Uncharacterized protein n=1 Tax=Knipowitschia caucasica TaxID=637954 RepID=A0AAV2ME70_KNICA